MAISRFKTSTLAQGLPKYTEIWDQSATIIDNSYESISTITVGAGGSSAVTFTSIPTTYTHLQLRFWGYSTRGSGNSIDDYNIRVGNGSIDTGSNYAYHYMLGNGSGLENGASSATTVINVPLCVGDVASGSQAQGTAIVDIQDYTNANKLKTLRAMGGNDLNGTAFSYGGRAGMVSGLWASTNAINQITLYCANGNWGQYSKFALYGVK